MGVSALEAQRACARSFEAASALQGAHQAACGTRQRVLDQLAKVGGVLITGFENNLHLKPPSVGTQSDDRGAIVSEKADNPRLLLPINVIMSQSFSDRHLYYFWVVGKEGGIARAGYDPIQSQWH